MDKTDPSRPMRPVTAPDRGTAGRRSPRGGVRTHFLVACLAGGLQATYAPQPETEVADHFAGLIARLDGTGPDVR